MRKVLFLVGFLSLCIPFAVSADEAQIEDGKVIFAEYCSGCHGKRADGKGPQALNLSPKPQNLRNAAFIHYLTDTRMLSSISGGVRGTAMPAFELILSEERRNTVMQYVRSVTDDQQDLPSSSFAYEPIETMRKNPIPQSKESVLDGKKHYEKFCASCHGLQMNGKGNTSFSLKPQPRNLVVVTSWGEKPFIDYLNDGRVYDSITNGVPGTSMQPWIKVLNETQRWNVVNYLRRSADLQREKEINIDFED